MKKYTLCVTQECNLACDYCYIKKRSARMPISVAETIIDYIFMNTAPEEKIDIGFFGGEPLLEFNLIKMIVGMIERRTDYDSDRIDLTITTNGTIMSAEIATFLKDHHVLHFEDNIYLMSDEQWKEFSGHIIKQLREKLSKARSVSFDQLMAVSETVNALL